MADRVATPRAGCVRAGGTPGLTAATGRPTRPPRSDSAAEFAREWADAAYEKCETQSFYNEFFWILGVRRRTVARYEEHVCRLDDTSGFIDLF